MLPLRVRVYLVAMAMMVYSAFPRFLKADALTSDGSMSYPGHSFGVYEGFYPQQRCSRCILQSQLIGLINIREFESYWVLYITYLVPHLTKEESFIFLNTVNKRSNCTCKYCLDGLVSLLNAISTSVGYLMPKLSL